MNEARLDLYIAEMPDGDIRAPLTPPEREREVRAVGAESVRREKYFVWRLLEYAIRHSFGMSIEDAHLVKRESGKWTSEYFYLSLSHSGAALAVAVSTSPVGVDIEKIIEPRAQSFALRVLGESEYEKYESLTPKERPLFLTECWTRKESEFKMGDGEAFIPKKYGTLNSGRTSSLKIRGETYVFSVASPLEQELNILYNVKI